MNKRTFVWDHSDSFRVFHGANEESSRVITKKELRKYSGRWLVPELVNAIEEGPLLPTGDFPSTTGFTHLVSKKAVSQMGALFRKYGDFLPVKILDSDICDNFFLYRCTNEVDCLDLKQSTLKYSPLDKSKLVSIWNPVFNEDITPSEGMFILPNLLSSSIYVTNDFKNKVSEFKLRGMVLIERPFGGEKPWIS